MAVCFSRALAWIAAGLLGIAAALPAAIVPAAAQDTALYLKDGSQHAFYEHSHALVIGINDYTGHDPLPGADRDARMVQLALEEVGFAVTPVFSQTITGEKLRQTVQDFVDRHGYEENSRILIWFAGHGVTIDGEGYLLGADAPRLDAASPTLSKDLQQFYHAAMPMRLFGVHLRQMRARHVMLVLDSCFSGSIFTNTRSSAIGASNAEMLSPTRQIITSGTEGQKVADDGRFAQMFVRAIKGQTGMDGQSADRDGDGYVTGSELGSFLFATARTASQTPQFGRLPSTTIRASQSETLFLTDHADYEKGEFFFALPGQAPDRPVLAEPDRPVVVVGPADLVWSDFSAGTRIANRTADPVPVFLAPPPQVGEKALDLASGQVYPPAGLETKLREATVDGRRWLSFERDGRDYYLPGDKIIILRQ